MPAREAGWVMVTRATGRSVAGSGTSTVTS
jgi:hypothetical protein